MAKATRETDKTTAPPGGSARAFDESSGNVIVNGVGLVRSQDITKSPISNVPDSNASQAVIVNGRGAVRLGDVLLDTSSVAEGSDNVDIGD